MNFAAAKENGQINNERGKGTSGEQKLKGKQAKRKGKEGE
jgi:hypothetical protein